MKITNRMTAGNLSILALMLLSSTMRTAAQAVRPKCPTQDCLDRCKTKSQKFPNPDKAYTRCSARCDKKCKTEAPSDAPTISAAPTQCPDDHNKRVTIDRFEIRGDLDSFSDDVEVQMKINGKKLWNGFREYDDESDNSITEGFENQHAKTITVQKGEPLTVSLIEHNFLGNKSVIGDLNKKWYDPICAEYFVIIMKEYDAGGGKNELKACLEMKIPDLVPFLSGNLKLCKDSQWVDPPKSITWVIRVNPKFTKD